MQTQSWSGGILKLSSTVFFCYSLLPDDAAGFTVNLSSYFSYQYDDRQYHRTWIKKGQGGDISQFARQTAFVLCQSMLVGGDWAISEPLFVSLTGSQCSKQEASWKPFLVRPLRNLDGLVNRFWRQNNVAVCYCPLVDNSSCSSVPCGSECQINLWNRGCCPVISYSHSLPGLSAWKRQNLKHQVHKFYCNSTALNHKRLLTTQHNLYNEVTPCIWGLTSHNLPSYCTTRKHKKVFMRLNVNISSLSSFPCRCIIIFKAALHPQPKPPEVTNGQTYAVQVEDIINHNVRLFYGE